MLGVSRFFFIDIQSLVLRADQAELYREGQPLVVTPLLCLSQGKRNPEMNSPMAGNLP